MLEIILLYSVLDVFVEKMDQWIEKKNLRVCKQTNKKHNKSSKVIKLKIKITNAITDNRLSPQKV